MQSNTNNAKHRDANTTTFFRSSRCRNASWSSAVPPGTLRICSCIPINAACLMTRWVSKDSGERRVTRACNEPGVLPPRLTPPLTPRCVLRAGAAVEAGGVGADGAICERSPAVVARCASFDDVAACTRSTGARGAGGTVGGGFSEDLGNVASGVTAIAGTFFASAHEHGTGGIADAEDGAFGIDGSRCCGGMTQPAPGGAI